MFSCATVYTTSVAGRSPIEHTNAPAFVEGYRRHTQQSTTEVKISTFRHDRTPHLIIIK